MYRNTLCRYNRKLILGVLIFVALSIGVQAVVLGVSPSKLEFQKVEREQEYSKYLIAITTDDVLECEVYAKGTIAQWITFDVQRFTIEKNLPHRLNVLLNIPDSTPNGVYEGNIVIRGEPVENKDGKTGMEVGGGISIKVSLEVTGRESAWMRVLLVNVEGYKVGDPIKTDIVIKNNAAIPLRPRITLEALSHDRTKTYSQITSSREMIMPKDRDTVTTYLPSKDMGPGIYVMYVKVDDDVGKTFETYETFHIFGAHENTITAKENGTLDYVVIKNSNLTLGEKATIFADFTNTGDLPLYAVIKAKTLNEDGEEISLYTSEEEYFEVGLSRRISFDFEPKEIGNQKVLIWGEYAGKKTATYQSSITVWAFTRPLIPFDINFYWIILPMIGLIIFWSYYFYRKYYKRNY